MAFSEMVDFLDASYIAKDEIVPCLIGPVGIGKTAAVLQHAKNVGANNVVTIIASQILPNEVSGITMPDSKSKSMEIYDHYRLSSLEDGDILFFDELLEADQLVLSACLTLIESRMLMSGSKLPDIQIIAATNPTVSPVSLKENIRQRFLFRSFNLDRNDLAFYIKNKYNVKLTRDILSLVDSSGDKFNILSPRSLTKMVDWIMKAPEDKLDEVAYQINECWSCSIGSDLRDLRIDGPKDEPFDIISDTIKQIATDVIRKEYEFSTEMYNDIIQKIDQSTSLNKMIPDLCSMPGWKYIEKELKNTELPEVNIF